MLENGDVFATRGNFPLGTISQHLFTPTTDRYHFGLVGTRETLNPLCDYLHLPLIKGDYGVVESVMKGITIGELSQYDKTDIKFYRVNTTPEIRKNAVIEMSGYTRSGYDIILFLRILLFVIIAEYKSIKASWKPRKIKVEELPTDCDSQFICTEGVAQGYADAGFNLIHAEVLAIPSAYKQAELEGRMVELDNTLTQPVPVLIPVVPFPA